MKKLLVALLTLFLPVLMFGVEAEEKPSGGVVEFVESYIAEFNQRKLLNKFFHYPHVWLVGSDATPITVTDVEEPIVDYEKLTEMGWHHSNINELKVIYESEDRAFVTLDFSRINALEEEILRSTALYTITKLDGAWGFAIMASVSPFIMRRLE